MKNITKENSFDGLI